MATLPLEYWTIGGGLLFLGLLAFAGLWYFLPIHSHQQKFKS